ncbi:MAG TPA: DUF2299 family protein [Nitrosopumilaceae archaeon]|nr:DUF2299 family protein [Nitrosopumilaceae archaeon]
MMAMLRDSVERWLVHGNHRFSNLKTDEDLFHLVIKHLGAFGNSVEIFQPKNQPNTLVIGSKIPLKNNQNARFLKLSDDEKKQFEDKVASFCQSIQAVHRFHTENGKKIVGVYVVNEDAEKLNQNNFFESIERLVEMADKTTQFLVKTF